MVTGSTTGSAVQPEHPVDTLGRIAQQLQSGRDAVDTTANPAHAGSLTRWSSPRREDEAKRRRLSDSGGELLHVGEVGSLVGQSPLLLCQEGFGHASLDTSARHFRAGTAEQAAVVNRVFD